MGPCAAARSTPAITDFTVMVDQTSHMFITGPDVIKTVTGEDVEFEELGAPAHTTASPAWHMMGADEQDALDIVKNLLSYLPSNNMDPAPVFDNPAPPSTSPTRTGARHHHPGLPNQPYDITP